MCGIAGFVDLQPHSGDAESILKRMTGAIRHRGPDDSGSYVDNHAALGHRRLSIIDLSPLGHQPMPNEDESLWIVYNGEIFNHVDLRPELEAAGHAYRSRSDTETIIHAYEQYGSDSVKRYRGMFAYAIWDRNRHRLFCVRDRLGIKPFYYYWDGRVFAFASEIKALFEHPSISPRLNDAVLPEYLSFGYVSSEQTMFSGIKKLMPGHTLELDLSATLPKPVIRQYWDLPDPVASTEQRSDEQWIAECRQRLEETVRMRLMSDVPLGMFLSGGVDSSAIAAMVKRMIPGPLKTFSVGYAEEQYSELKYAKEVADAIGTEHREIKIGMEDFFDALPKLIWHEDEPITWPSSVSLHFVSMLAAKEVTVVLTGEGSDELFGGYVRYRWTRMNLQLLDWYRRFAPGFLRRALRSHIATTSLLSADTRRKIGHSFLGREENIESLYLDNFYAAFSGSELETLFQNAPDASPYSNFMSYWNQRDAKASQLSQMLYADQKTYLVELLMKQDQMSMSASIESRVPLLDHTFVEFAARIPDHLKINGTTQKHIFKEAVADLLPASIVHRKKMGFPTPLLQWLREPRAARLLDALTERDGFLASYLDLDAVRRLIERHRSGAHDETDRIWRLLNLQMWGDIFLSGRRDRWLEAEAAITEPSLR